MIARYDKMRCDEIDAYLQPVDHDRDARPYQIDQKYSLCLRHPHLLLVLLPDCLALGGELPFKLVLLALQLWEKCKMS